MSHRAPLYVVLGILISHLAAATGSRSFSCGHGHYYSIRESKCKKCSMCPANQIILMSCTEFADRKCGDFDFNDFPDFEPGVQISYPNSLDHSGGENEQFAPNSDTHDRNHGRGKSHNGDLDGPTTVEKEDREYWKTLAFALIGLLSVLIIVATVIVLLACRKLQRASVIKQPEEGDMDDADSGYVVIRAIRHLADNRPGCTDLSYYTREDFESHPPLLRPLSSDTDPQSVIDPVTHPHPGRLCFLPKVYKPQRRLLTYDTDDVFESDDSGSVCKIPTRNKLCTVTETSVSASSEASDSKKMVDSSGDIN